MIYGAIYCSSFGSLHRSHICFIGLAANTCAHHTPSANPGLFWSDLLARWQKKMSFLLYHGGVLTGLFAPAPARFTPKSCPALLAGSALRPRAGIPFVSHDGATNLNCCFKPPRQAIHFSLSNVEGQLATGHNPGFMEIKDKSPISGRSSCPKSLSLEQLFKSTVIPEQIESSLTIGSTSETIHRHIFSPSLTGNRACVTFTVTWSSRGRPISHLNKQTVFLPW